MVESEIGDNTLILCKSCGYAANVEKAECQADYDPAGPEKGASVSSVSPLETIDTPNVKTIDELCAFLNTDAKHFIKTLIYRAVNVELDLSSAPGCAGLSRQKGVSGAPGTYPEAFFAVAIRGDLDVNEVKLAAVLKASEAALASDTDVLRITGAPVGFAGPVGLATVPVILDHSVTGMSGAVAGALEKDKHYRNVLYGRDFTGWLSADLRTVKAGDRCSLCGGELYEKKGNELGHIFKLGAKYTQAMGVRYLDENGASRVPVMGCYGIGLDRTLASIIEEHHDEQGIIWPVTVAPFHVIIVPIKYQGEVKTASDKLAAELESAGLDVLLDDRDERAGVKFNDADLLGIPWRVVVGEKNLAASLPQVEIKRRNEKEATLVTTAKAAAKIAESVRAEYSGN
jgi:prolyl-tRNA synthetase